MQWDLIFSNAFYAAIAVNAIGYCLIAVGLNVHFGYTGLLNFGQAGFAAIGAYAVAVPIARYGWSLWAAIPIIFVGGIVLGLILGVPTLRLRADYLAIVTIASAEIIRLIVGSERFRWLFGGQDGLQGYTQQLQDFNPFGGRYTVWAQSFGGYDLFIIIIGWIIVVLTSLLVWSLMRSPWGRVLEEHPRGRGRRPQPRQERLLVQDAEPDRRRHHRRPRWHGHRRRQPGRPARQLLDHADVLRLHDPHPRRRGAGEGTDHRRHDLLVHDHARRQHPRRGGAHELRCPSWLPSWLNINGTNFGQVKYIIAGAALAVLVVFRPQGIFGDRREQAFDVR